VPVPLPTTYTHLLWKAHACLPGRGSVCLLGLGQSPVAAWRVHILL